MRRYFVSYFVQMKKGFQSGFGNGVYEIDKSIQSIDEINTLQDFIAERLMEETGEKCKVIIINFQEIEEEEEEQ